MVRDDSHELEDLKALVESGQTVVELDPSLIDESFIRDRMEDGTQSIADLAHQIEEPRSTRSDPSEASSSARWALPGCLRASTPEGRRFARNENPRGRQAID